TAPRPTDPRSARPCRILHDQASGKIANHDTTHPASGFPHPAKYRPHRERERIVLPDRPAALVHDRQPVDVGIDRDAERGAGTRDEGRKPTEVFRDRLRGSGEAPVGLEVDTCDLTPQALEQRAHDRPSRAPHRVEGHRELPLPDPLDIDRRQLEYGLEVPLHRALIRRNLPRPPSSSPVLPRQLQHPRTIRSVQENAVRAYELQGIPLYWVVTGSASDHDAGSMVL